MVGRPPHGAVINFSGQRFITNTGDDIFVWQYSPSSGWGWVTGLAPRPPGVDASGNGIVVDSLGHVDIVGGVTRTPNSGNRIIIAQFDRDTGDTLWLRAFGSLNGLAGASGTSIAAVPRLGSKGALLDITGSINGSIVFAGKNVKSTALGSIFVGQLTEAGVQEWGRAVRNPNGVVTSGAGIAVDPTTREIFAVGTAKETPTARCSSRSIRRRVVLGKPDQFGQAPQGVGTGVAFDGNGHLYVTAGAITPGAGTPEVDVLKLAVRH